MNGYLVSEISSTAWYVTAIDGEHWARVLDLAFIMEDRGEMYNIGRLVI